MFLNIINTNKIPTDVQRVLRFTNDTTITHLLSKIDASCKFDYIEFEIFEPIINKFIKSSLIDYYELDNRVYDHYYENLLIISGFELPIDNFNKYMRKNKIKSVKSSLSNKYELDNGNNVTIIDDSLSVGWKVPSNGKSLRNIQIQSPNNYLCNLYTDITNITKEFDEIQIYAYANNFTNQRYLKVTVETQCHHNLIMYDLTGNGFIQLVKTDKQEGVMILSEVLDNLSKYSMTLGQVIKYIYNYR